MKVPNRLVGPVTSEMPNFRVLGRVRVSNRYNQETQWTTVMSTKVSLVRCVNKSSEPFLSQLTFENNHHHRSRRFFLPSTWESRSFSDTGCVVMPCWPTRDIMAYFIRWYSNRGVYLLSRGERENVPKMVLADLGRKITSALRSLSNATVINEEVNLRFSHSRYISEMDLQIYKFSLLFEQRKIEFFLWFNHLFQRCPLYFCAGCFESFFWKIIPALSVVSNNLVSCCQACVYIVVWVLSSLLRDNLIDFAKDLFSYRRDVISRKISLKKILVYV